VDRSDVTRALERADVSGDAREARASRFERLLDRMAGTRSDRERWHGWFVPGRIEVLGKHTDYAGGRSLIGAADRGFHVLAAPRDDRRLVLSDLARHKTLTLEPDLAAPAESWATYPRTVLNRLVRNFPELTRGADILFDSDLPSAAGMSSSSALMIAVLLVLARVNRLERTATWATNIGTRTEDLATYAATIENGQSFRGLLGDRGVGTEGGSEDHTAIFCSAPARLAQFSFCPTRRERSIPMPAHTVFAIGVSGVAARKTGEARDDYNRASRIAAQVLATWRAHSNRNDASLGDAVESSPDAARRIRELLAGDEERRDRFEQFVEESTVLIPAAGDALTHGNLDSFGAIVDRSQEMATRLLRNQVPETVALAHTARANGALAASSFGAGFGGSVWALVELADAAAFLERWKRAYQAAAGTALATSARATFFLTTAGAGCFEI
jgi:galactokinase